MASAGDNDAPVALKAVDASYPLVGQLRLKDGRIVGAPPPGTVWLAEGAAERLEVAPGGTISIGGQALNVGGIVAEEPDSLSEGFAMGAVAIVRGRFSRARRADLARRDVSHQAARCAAPGPGPRRSRVAAQATVSRRRLPLPHPRQGRARGRALHREHGAVPRAGRPGRAGHRRDRHRRRGLVLSRSAARQHRHAESAGREQRRYCPHLPAPDRRSGAGGQSGGPCCRRADDAAAGERCWARCCRSAPGWCSILPRLRGPQPLACWSRWSLPRRRCCARSSFRRWR